MRIIKKDFMNNSAIILKQISFWSHQIKRGHLVYSSQLPENYFTVNGIFNNTSVPAGLHQHT
jgi:hypothetical protein